MPMNSIMGKARIGIFESADWLGGSNYLRVLLSNLSELQVSGRSDADFEVVGISKPGASPPEGASWPSIRNDIHSTRSPVFHLLLSRTFPRLLTRGSHRVAAFAQRHQLTHLFPSAAGGIRWPWQATAADWIPDFAHISSPENFTQAERDHRDADFARRVRSAGLVFVSSDTSASIYKKLYPDSVGKLRVFKFRVSAGKELGQTMSEDARVLHGLPRKYAIVCNQMWKHKKHDMVVRALSAIKQHDPSICVVFTGPTEDRTHPEYPNHVMDPCEKHEFGRQYFDFGENTEA